MKIKGNVIVFILIIALVGCLSVLMITRSIYVSESADSVYQRGRKYLKQGKLDEAIREFSKSIAFNPRADEAYYDRGRAYSAKGDLDKALEDYTQAIHCNSPESIQSAYNNRGQIYQEKGDLDKALEDYTKGIDTMPNPMFSGFRYFKQVLHRNRAEVYREKKEYNKALEDVRSIEKLGGSVDPKFIAQLKNRDSSSPNGEVKEKSEKFPGASSDVNFYNSRGYNSFKKGQLDLAITDYNQALEVDPSDPIVLANRANAYAAKGDFDKAIVDYTKAVEVNPKDSKIFHDLGMAHVNKGDFDKAIYFFNKILEINPEAVNDGQFHNDRAVAYFGEKEYDNCWDDVNEAIKLGYSIHPQFLSELKKATGREK